MSTSPKIAIRLRKINSKDSSEYQNAITYEDNIIKVTDNQETLETQFDKIFGPLAPQEEIFNFICPLIESCDKGINSTIFTYGQTGSGKSLTMFGNSSNYGIIQKTIFHIFRILSSGYIIRISMFDIYNEVITDLLEEIKNSKLLSVRHHVNYGVYIKNLLEYIIQSPDEAINLITKGVINSNIKSTYMSVSSSRMHTMCQITILSTRPNENDKFYRSKITFCDFAGSENNKKSNIYKALSGRFSITNNSFLALGKVISTVVSGKSGYVPYRDSKLTFLLKESLEGHNKLALIATINPIKINFTESYQTIKFASIFKQYHLEIKVHEMSLKKYTIIENFEKKKNICCVGNFDINHNAFKSNREIPRSNQDMTELEKIMNHNKIKRLALEKLKFNDSTFSVAYIFKSQIEHDKTLNNYHKKRDYRFSKSLDIDKECIKMKFVGKGTAVKRFNSL